MAEILPHCLALAISSAIPPAAITEAAALLEVGEPEICAVLDVEASGRAYDSRGHVVRRFEPHKMPREHWPAIGFDPAGAAPWRASLALPVTEREAAFRKAIAIDLETAYRAASWGAPQIMGFNARPAGHETARDMVEAMARDPAEHVLCFARLVRSWGLAPSIRAHDWEHFARVYNGDGQAEVYAAKLRRAYRREVVSLRGAVLRLGSRGAEVRRLQRLLAGAAGPVDGAFGERTDAAVRDAQRRHGLAVDGVVGPATWAALEAEQ